MDDALQVADRLLDFVWLTCRVAIQTTVNAVHAPTFAEYLKTEESKPYHLNGWISRPLQSLMGYGTFPVTYPICIPHVST